MADGRIIGTSVVDGRNGGTSVTDGRNGGSSVTDERNRGTSLTDRRIRGTIVTDGRNGGTSVTSGRKRSMSATDGWNGGGIECTFQYLGSVGLRVVPTLLQLSYWSSRAGKHVCRQSPSLLLLCGLHGLNYLRGWGIGARASSNRPIVFFNFINTVYLRQCLDAFSQPQLAPTRLRCSALSCFTFS